MVAKHAAVTRKLRISSEHDGPRHIARRSPPIFSGRDSAYGQGERRRRSVLQQI